MHIETNDYLVKLADTDAEVRAAMALRHEVFVADYDAAPTASGLDQDVFDAQADHLVLIDKSDPGRVVAVSRLIQAGGPRGFYSATEFDLGPLEQSGRRLVEIGRTCVAPDHQGGLALHLMWTGLADYVLRRDIELVFGVASFPGLDPAAIADALGYLQTHHLAPETLRPVARGAGALRIGPNTASDRLRALTQMPPLLRSYLRLGCQIGQDAYVDRDFCCIDVLVLLDRTQIAERYRGLLARGLAA